MSLSYLEPDLAKTSRVRKPGTEVATAPLSKACSWLTATAWQAAASPNVLSAALRVVSALALSFWLVQVVKHHIS